ncbi:RNA-directed DNA polymerase, eukaryota [Tanacetum coccineum]
MKRLCIEHGVTILGIQETKLTQVDLFAVKAMWGNFQFEVASSSARGNSGGILTIWDPAIFSCTTTLVTDNVLIVEGNWAVNNVKCFLLNVYAPQSTQNKIEIWNFILSFMQNHVGEYIVFGDFNVVRFAHERQGTVFCQNMANDFNQFITAADLSDIPMGGRTFTRMNKQCTKFSKLDRFLVTNGILEQFPSLHGRILSNIWSDHNLILLKNEVLYYGPTPFKLFDSWLEHDGFDNIVWDAWNEPAFTSEAIGNGGSHTQNLATQRMDILKNIASIEKLESLDLAQKSRRHWCAHGENNTKFFHATLKRKHKKFVVSGVMSNGMWIMNPTQVKNTFLDFFSSKFNAFNGISISHPSPHLKSLTSTQRELLSSDFTESEIKDAVWSCGSDKSPGPDEGLHAAIEDAISSILFRGLSIGSKGLHISHFLYADDALFIGEWNEQNINNLITILSCFYMVSGLQINIQKSNLFGLRIQQLEVVRLASETGCSASSLPFTYLGLPVGINMKNEASWCPVIDKIKNDLTTGSKDEDRKISWIKWKQALNTKEKWGLSIGSVQALNSALILKWKWRLLNSSESLWVQIIKGIHGDYGGLLTSSFKSFNHGVRVNIIRCIHHLHDKQIIPRNLLIRNLGNGRSVKFWEDDWHESGPWKFKYPRLYALESNHSCLVVDRYVPSKVNIFAWRLLLNRHPTRINIMERGIDIPSILCSICNSQQEDAEHLFLHCEVASQIWHRIGIRLDFTFPTFSRVYDIWEISDAQQ